MLEIINKVSTYSKNKRIMRLIEIGVKGDSATVSEQFELGCIQAIREQNGEIDQVIKYREMFSME